jgi:GR25 family glycosyltransferase involved in LPS biosynthesis
VSTSSKMFKLDQSNFEENINRLNLQISRGVPGWKIYSWINELLTVPYDDDKFIMQLLRLQGGLRMVDDQSFNPLPIEDALGVPLTKYNRDLCDRLLKKIITRPRTITENSIIITMTTCKRYNLFEQTVNSFLECCRDLEDYIFCWLVVDDNSSAEDRDRMKRDYPFMTFVFKDSENKGHARSMNILRDKVLEINAPFIFHLEDDFRFFVPGKWLTMCLTVLRSNNQYGQCLLNRCYGEDIEKGSMIWGGHRRYIQHPEKSEHMLRYYIHEYAIGTALDRMNKQLVTIGTGNCMYWPHFSLRVGLTRSNVYRTIGAFNESAAHFEREYAGRYRLQYLTTFLDNVVCTHIGRRTYERSGPKLNAYDLNLEKQFGTAPKGPARPTTPAKGPARLSNPADHSRSENDIDSEIKLDSVSLAVKNRTLARPTTPADHPCGENNLSATKDGTIPVNQAGVKGGDIAPLAIKIYVLNLQRRPDRLQKFREMNRAEMVHFHVFNAIDGLSLTPGLTIQRLFEPSDFNYRSGIVGCTISHIMMWSEIASTPNLHGMLIIEDDARLCKNFIVKFLRILNTTPQADIIFLHHHAYPSWQKKDDTNELLIPTATEWTKDESIKRSMGGTTAYYITKAGASRLLQEIDKKGIKYAIDWVMFHYNVNRVFYASPFLAFADCAQIHGADSDIQKDYSGVGFKDNNKWLATELSYWGEKGVKNAPLESGIPQDEKSKIIFNPEMCEIKLLLTNIVLFPRSDSLEQLLKEYPVHFCPAGKWILSIPDPLLTSADMKNRTFNSYLSISALTETVKKS